MFCLHVRYTEVRRKMKDHIRNTLLAMGITSTLALGLTTTVLPAFATSSNNGDDDQDDNNNDDGNDSKDGEHTIMS